MNWGKSIVLAFVLFGAFMATLVTVCFRQDVSLVTADYYKEELAFQDQIDRMANTSGLEEKPDITTDGAGVLKVTFNKFYEIESGDLQLFRPSDPRLDKQFPLSHSKESSRYFSVKGFKKGLYRARMQWKMSGKEFFFEQVIYL
ncbi:MAG TPA: FixH family protein [Chryseosolibacter sp.]